MPKLFAFGDSLTQGVGLEKHITPYSSQHSIYAWPQLVADQLGYHVHNLSLGGSSIKEITHTITQNIDKISDHDIALVMWTSGMHRTCILEQDQDTPTQLGHWSIDSHREIERDIATVFIKHMSNKRNMVFDHGMAIKLADTVLRSRTPNVLHLSVQSLSNGRIGHLDDDGDFFSLLHIIDQPWVSVPFVEQFGLFSPEVTPIYAEYDDHYSKEQHAHFSEKLCEYIRKNRLTQ